MFGISSSLRHFCAMALPNTRIEFLRYNWKAEIWNIMFVLGIVIGSFLASAFLSSSAPSLLPPHYHSVSGAIKLLLGGFLVGFGARYAGGCTSGHAIMGLSDLQPSSLVAVICFFLGGFLMLGIFQIAGVAL